MVDAVAESQRVKRIRETILAEGQRLREKYPWLKHQNALGLTIFSLAVMGTGLSAWSYTQGFIPAWLCIPLVAIFTSLLHELEHDLIHWQYFKNKKWLHNFMLLVGWILRPGTINPWVRRHLHFLHHKVSGSEKDLEERGIANGMKYGPLRLFIMFDTFVGNLLKVIIKGEKGKKTKRFLQICAINFPLAFVCAGIWYSFLVFHISSGVGDLIGNPVIWSQAVLTNMEWVDIAIVIWIAPFYLRSFSLNFISSNMHYYGNVNNLIHQTQVLNHPLFLPFQIFCFNFGSTHGIHHFVVKEPFYIRQMTAKVAHQVMKENGVRFNDLNTFKRANNFLFDLPDQNMIKQP